MKNIASLACVGDCVEFEREGFTLRARVEVDHDGTAEDPEAPACGVVIEVVRKVVVKNGNCKWEHDLVLANDGLWGIECPIQDGYAVHVVDQVAKEAIYLARGVLSEIAPEAGAERIKAARTS